MAGKKPTMRENISSRPTDSSGRRASNADLGIGAGAAALRKAAAEKIMKREGTTSSAGGRAAPKALGAISNKDRQMLTSAAAKIKPAAAPKNLGAISNKDRQMLTTAAAKIKPVQIIRTTTAMKPTPMGKKR
jgi:hypothetical protein